MAVNATTKKSLEEQINEMMAEIAEMDYEDDPAAYKEKANAVQKLSKQYMTEKVTIKLPRPRGDEDRYLFVGWNGKGYSIEKGKEVSVPRGVAQIIEISEAQSDEAYDLMNGLSDEFASDPRSN